MLDVDKRDLAEMAAGKLPAIGEAASTHAAIVARHIGAASALWLADQLELDLAPHVAGDVLARFVDILDALPPRARLECCERLKLPISVRAYGRNAGAVLRKLIEDEVLRPFFADGAARLWIELDLRDVALPAALGIVEEVSSMTIMSLAQMVEPEEAFEFLHARFEREPFFAELVSRSPLLRGLDAWVPPALTRLHDDPRNAARMLATIGTPRAFEELGGAIVASVDNVAVFDVLWEEAGTLPGDVVIDVIAAVVQQPGLDAGAVGRVHSFGQRCRHYAVAVRQRELDGTARAMFDEILRMNPVQPRTRWGGGVLG